MKVKNGNYKLLAAIWILIIIAFMPINAKAEEVTYVEDIFMMTSEDGYASYVLSDEEAIDFLSIDKVEIGYVTNAYGSMGGGLGYSDSNYDWKMPQFENNNLDGETEGTFTFDEIGGVGYYMQLQVWWLEHAEDGGVSYFLITYVKLYDADGNVIYHIVDEDTTIRYVESIEVVSGEIDTLYENYDGSIWYEYDEDYENIVGEYFEYYYDTYDLLIQINYSDGTSVTGTVGDTIAGRYIYCVDNQDEVHWSVGGNNYVTIEYWDKSISVPVTIVENPVKYIELVSGTSYTPIENYDGYLDECYNEETGEYEEYFYYPVSEWDVSDAVIKIVYKDGTSITASPGEWPDDEHGFWVNDNQYEKHWSLGSDNYAVIEFLGHEIELPITIVENPVKYIELVSGTAYTPIENYDGYLDEYYNEETGEYEEYFYYYFWDEYVSDAVIKIVYKDGTSITASPGEWPDDEHKIWVNDNQYEKHWSLGSDNYAVIEFLGHEIELPITIVENPVKSMEILSLPTIEYIWGDLQHGFHYYSDEQYDFDPWNFEGMTVKVNYTDGSSETVVFNDETDYYELKYDEMWVSGYYEDATPGDYTFEVSYLGKSVEFEITLQESYVESLEVIKEPEMTECVSPYFSTLEGMQIQINYKDGSSKIVTLELEDYEFYYDSDELPAWYIDVDGSHLGISIQEGHDSETGEFVGYGYMIMFESKTIVYEDFVQVPSVAAESIELLEVNEERTYMKVEVFYEDGTSEIIALNRCTDYYCSTFVSDKGMITAYKVYGDYDVVGYNILGIDVYFDDVKTDNSNSLLGDVDQDGDVDSDDAIYLLYHSLLPEEYPVSEACEPDFNGDATVDSDDAIYLLYHTLLPEEYPLKNGGESLEEEPDEGWGEDQPPQCD